MVIGTPKKDELKRRQAYAMDILEKYQYTIGIKQFKQLYEAALRNAEDIDDDLIPINPAYIMRDLTEIKKSLEKRDIKLYILYEDIPERTDENIYSELGEDINRSTAITDIFVNTIRLYHTNGTFYRNKTYNQLKKDGEHGSSLVRIVVVLRSSGKEQYISDYFLNHDYDNVILFSNVMNKAIEFGICFSELKSFMDKIKYVVEPYGEGNKDDE